MKRALHYARESAPEKIGFMYFSTYRSKISTILTGAQESLTSLISPLIKGPTSCTLLGFVILKTLSVRPFFHRDTSVSDSRRIEYFGNYRHTFGSYTAHRHTLPTLCKLVGNVSFRDHPVEDVTTNLVGTLNMAEQLMNLIV